MSFPPIRFGSVSGTAADGGDMVSRDTSVATTAYNQINTALTGAASSVRSLVSRFQDRANVFDYPNIVGDGSHDDSAGLQVAINDCAGKRSLLFPTNYTFNINAPLNIPSNSQLIIDGTIFKQAMSVGATQFSNIQIIGSNIRISGAGIIEGNRANQTVTNFAAAGIVTIYRQYTTTIFPFDATSYSTAFNNIHIDGITIQNTFNWPISVSLQNSIITNCTFINGGNSPQIIDSLNTHFLKCTAIGTLDDGLGLYGGNSYCSVDSCTVSNSITGVFCLSDDANTGISDRPSSNCSLINNICYNCTLAGVFVDGGSSITTTTTVADMILVANNLIQSCPSGLRIVNVVASSIVGNVVQQTVAGGSATDLLGILQYVNFSDNTIVGFSSIACITVSNDNASNTSLQIVSNRLYNIDPTHGGSFGVNLQSSGSSAYISVLDNDVFGNIVLAFTDQSPTPAATFRGVSTVNNTANQRLQTQGLLIRPWSGASGTGIDLEPNGNGNFGGNVNVVGTITANNGNVVANQGVLVSGTTSTAALSVSGASKFGSSIGFYGHSPVAQITITGSKAGNTALANLITQLASSGLLIDNTT